MEEADGGLVVKSTRIGGSERMRNRGAVGTHVVGQDLRQTRRYRLGEDAIQTISVAKARSRSYLFNRHSDL